VYSTALTIINDVSQSSELGPLMFNMYINDLVSNCKMSGNCGGIYLYVMQMIPNYSALIVTCYIIIEKLLSLF